MNLRKYRITATVLFLLPLFLYADSIVLKNGKRIHGVVKNQENNIVTIITNQGETKQVKKQDIVSMIYAASTTKSKPKENKKPIVANTNSTKTENKDDEELNQNLFSSNDKVQINNNEKIVEKSEKVTVDKELTNSVMEKFEQADKRRIETTNKELDVLKEELDYLRKEKERIQKNTKEDDEFRKTLDKRMASLEIRIRRLEKYLGMDESMVEYYQRKRSPWDLVWRSSLFPGWGHRYAREEYTGNAYSTSIIVLYLLHYFINYQANAAEDVAKVALYNDAIVKTVQYSSIGVPATYSGTFVLNGYATYQTTMSAVNSQKELAGNFLNLAVGLYLIQIVHSYFTGLEWAKVQPRNYSNDELLKPTGLNIKSKPDINIFSRTPERGILYEVEFTQRF